jgi:hypothetical protein
MLILHFHISVRHFNHKSARAVDYPREDLPVSPAVDQLGGKVFSGIPQTFSFTFNIPFNQPKS